MPPLQPLGFGLLRMLLPHFGQPGAPSLELAPHQRPLQSSHVDSFARNEILYNEEKFAILLAVDPDCLDHQTLHANAAKAVEAKFKVGTASVHPAWLADGQHRLQALRVRAGDDWLKLEADMAKIQKMVDGGKPWTQGQNGLLGVRERKALEDRLKDKGWMLVQFYDRRLYTDKDPSIVVQRFKLTVNCQYVHLAPRPDSFARHLMKTLAVTTDPAAREDIFEHAKKLQFDNTSLNVLISRAPDVFQSHGLLIQIASFEKYLPKVKELFQLKQHVWQFLQATMLGGLRQLLFLVTDCVDEEGAPRLEMSFYQDEPVFAPHQARLTKALIKIFDSAFEMHLESRSDLIYQNDEALQSHFDAYKQFILEHVITDAEKEAATVKNQEDKALIQALLPTLKSRVQYLFDNPDFSLRLLPWTSQTPLLSPKWYSKLVGIWLSMSDGINMFLHWMVPGLSFLLRPRRARKTQSANSMLPLKSASEYLLEWLFYFHGSTSKESDQWALSLPYDQRSDAEPAMLLRYHTCMNELALIFLKHRTIAFLDNKSYIDNYAMETDTKVNKTDLSTYSDLITKWFTLAHEKQKSLVNPPSHLQSNLKCKVTPRILAHVPDHLFEKFEDQSAEMQLFVILLESTCVNFFTTGQSSNDKLTQQHAVTQFWYDVHFRLDIAHDNLRQVPVYRLILQQCIDTMRQLKSFRQYDPWVLDPLFWSDTLDVDDGGLPLPSQGAVSRSKARIAMEQQRERLRRFVLGIYKEAARTGLGITVENKDRGPGQPKNVKKLHPSILVAIRTLHHAMFLHSAPLMHHYHGTEEGRVEFYEAFDPVPLPEHLEAAELDEVALFCQIDPTVFEFRTEQVERLVALSQFNASTIPCPDDGDDDDRDDKDDDDDPGRDVDRLSSTRIRLDSPSSTESPDQTPASSPLPRPPISQGNILVDDTPKQKKRKHQWSSPSQGPTKKIKMSPKKLKLREKEKGSSHKPRLISPPH